MISASDRVKAVELIEQAVAGGARTRPACELLGLSVRTVQRWTGEGDVKADARPTAIRPTPRNRLCAREREAALAVCHAPRYDRLPSEGVCRVVAGHVRLKFG